MIDWVVDNTPWIIGILLLALAVFIVIGIYGDMRWQQWANQHCKVIGEVSPSSGIGFTTNGKMTTVFVPGKTGYACDNGQQYWR